MIFRFLLTAKNQDMKIALMLYGINYQDDFPKYFTVRVMSPAIVLREIKVSSPKELAIITDLPMNLAEQRFTRLQQL